MKLVSRRSFLGYIFPVFPFPSYYLTFIHCILIHQLYIDSYISQYSYLRALLFKIAEFSLSDSQSWASRQACRLSNTAACARSRISASYSSIESLELPPA